MDIWSLGCLWFLLALIADFMAIRCKIAVALSEIIIGIAATFVIGWLFPGFAHFGSDTPWIQTLASFGAVLLTFLAGAELDPKALKGELFPILTIGLIGFFAPFIGSALVTYYLLGWSLPSSLLVGIALSTTSVAIVYAVMLELGLNQTKFGKKLLAACFVNDLGTVIGLGLLFAPFTSKTVVLLIALVLALFLVPRLTGYLFSKWGNRHSEQEAKVLFFFLLGLGFVAFWAGSEPVLPAYILGMALAKVFGSDFLLVKRIRAITFGLLTPFYFLRAGSLVSLPAIWEAPLIFLILFFTKMITKGIGVYPITKIFKYQHKEATYITLLMSTGLTFGTIASLYGLSHQIIDGKQYSWIVATVIASAILPTMIANRYFLPHKHIKKSRGNQAEVAIQREIQP